MIRRTKKLGYSALLHDFGIFLSVAFVDLLVGGKILYFIELGPCFQEQSMCVLYLSLIHI